MRQIKIFEKLSDNLFKSFKPEKIELSKENAHQLRDVLRVDIGDGVIVIAEGRDFQCQAEIIGVSKNSVSIKLIDCKKWEMLPSKVRSLIFALSKGDKNDLVCEKAAEWGAENIIFWQAERSVVRVKGPTDKKVDRWIKIARGSARICSGRVPGIYVAEDLNQLVSLIDQISKNEDLRLCFSLLAEAIPIQSLSFSAGAHLLIGPEGDISPQESNFLRENKFQFVNLGPYVLRSETAAISALALIQAKQ